MKKLKSTLEKPYAYFTLAALSGVLLYVILTNISSVFHIISLIFKFFSPVIIGAVTAYILNPVSVFFEKKLFKSVKSDSKKHICGVILTIICVILVLAVIIGSLIPSLLKSTSTLIENWDIYTLKAKEIIDNIKTFAISHKIKINFESLENITDNSFSKLIDVVKSNSKVILKTIGSIGSGVSDVAIGIIFGFCFLTSKRSILKLTENIRSAIFKKERIGKNNELIKRSNSIFLRYTECTLLDAFIVGAATLIFMLITGMPFAPLISLLVAVTNIIPTFGPMIGGAAGIFFLILDKPVNALWFFIFICILQGANGILLKPVLFKDSLGIPASRTLVLIIIGGKLLGIWGVILSIPVGAILGIIYNETVLPKLKKRKAEINKQNDNETAEK